MTNMVFYVRLLWLFSGPQVLMDMLPHQQPADRPDLLARVFRLKLRVLLDDLVKFHMLGRTQANIHVIEFQKRGLPHAHILLILALEDKLNSPEDYDRCASAFFVNGTVL